MVQKICCAFGHRELYTDIGEKLKKVIIDLIENKRVTLFYTGGMGETDMLFASIIRGLKKSYPHIQLILVKPYFSNDVNVNKAYYESLYNAVLIPAELAGCHYKSAIMKRNRWMIDCSAYVIDCTYREFGGAVQAIQYAKRTKKRIIKIS